MAISRIFDISKRSLSVYRKAMDVAAHNVANAGNEDYSRQRITVTSATPSVTQQFQWGSGVEIGTLKRIEDNLLTNQIIQNNQKYNGYNKQAELLSQVEVVFGEPTEFGLANYLNKFFDSFTSLSASPSSVEARKEVIYSAQNLSNKVKNVYDTLVSVKSDMEESLRQQTKRVNNLLSELKGVNLKIFQATAQGSEANDLMDKRDKIVNELSTLANIKVRYENTGAAQVYVGGVFGVSMDSVAEFKVIKGADGDLEVRTTNGDVKLILNEGEMGGITTIYNKKINSYLDRIDTLMNTLKDAVNNIHQKGYTLDATPMTGIKFFDDYKNGKLQINNQIITNPNKIAVSGDGTAGNGEYALQLAELKTADLFGGMNVMQYYADIVSDIGNTANSSKSQAESTDLVLQQLKSQKDSKTAVSIDEEMTNILQYQKSFNASAKMVKMANDMMDALFNMV